MSDYVEAAVYNDPLEGHYAGFWVKVAAPIFDLAVFIPIYWGLTKILGHKQAVAREIIFTLFILAAYAGFFASKWQASPGMWVLRVIACDKDGNKLSFSRGFMWGVVSMLGVMLCCSGVFYMEYRFDLNHVIQLLQSCQQENMRMDDCAVEIENLIGIPYETFSMMLFSSCAMALFLLLIWTLSVALTKDKSGFHNLITGTRFIKGRAV